MKTTTHIPGVFIAKPCTANWDEMTEAERGRFCTQCSKIVYDFTHADPVEFFKTYHEQKGNVCGRFYEAAPSALTVLKQRLALLLQQSKVALATLALGWGILQFKAGKAQQADTAATAQQAIPKGFTTATFVIKDSATGQIITKYCEVTIQLENYEVSFPAVTNGTITFDFPEELLGTTATIAVKGYRFTNRIKLYTTSPQMADVLVANTPPPPPKKRKWWQKKRRRHSMGCPVF